MQQSPFSARKTYGALAATLAGIVCSFLLRLFWQPLYKLIGCYPSDIWYIYTNYGWFLENQTFFRMEYPAPMLAVFKLLNLLCLKIGPLSEPCLLGGFIYPYNLWLSVNAIFLGFCALGSVWILGKLQREFFPALPYRLISSLIIAPTFLFFAVYNYDLLPILCCLAAFLALLRNDNSGAYVLLGAGASFKFYPLVLLPLFLRHTEPRQRWQGLLLCLGTWGVLNLPWYLNNPDHWLYAYTWQFQFNDTLQAGRPFFHLAQLLGKLPFLSLLAISGLALTVFLWNKYPENARLQPDFLAKGFFIMLLWFMLGKSVFSPQYFLWALPYAYLIAGFPWGILVTLVESLNVSESLFLEFWRSHHQWGLVIIRAIRDCSLIVCLYRSLWQIGTQRPIDEISPTCQSEDNK